jgi:hypothetical protein
MKWLACVFLSCWVIVGAAADWHSYKVYAPTPAAIQRVADSNLTLLSERIGAVTDVAAPSDSEVRKLGLRYERDRKLSDPTGAFERHTDGSDYTTEYFTLDEIIGQFEEWRLQYPSLIQREQIATTEQGRPVWAYRLHNPHSPLPATGIFFHGLIHAREWISGPVVMHNFKMLLDEALDSAAGWQRISRFDFNVVPVLNPDGYSYSWTNFRLWRKNRRVVNGTPRGVDLNRNYPIGWGGAGSSGNPGSDTYRGTAPFSEPELAGLRDYLNVRAAQTGIQYALDYHSYGQYVIHPLGYTETQAPDHAALNAIAHVYGNAVEATGGLNYTIGQSSVVQYPAGGTSEDFYYDEYNALGGTIELRPTGNPGFELPPSQIIPTITEHWAGFKAAISALN